MAKKSPDPQLPALKESSVSRTLADAAAALKAGTLRKLTDGSHETQKKLRCEFVVRQVVRTLKTFVMAQKMPPDNYDEVERRLERDYARMNSRVFTWLSWLLERRVPHRTGFGKFKADSRPLQPNGLRAWGGDSNDKKT